MTTLRDSGGVANERSDFGPFAGIIRRGGYLPLLGMRGADAVVTLTKIERVIRSAADHRRYVSCLLDDRNWRGHLIALAAVLMSDESAAYGSELWRAFDRGSWVAPQLAISLYCSDPGFVDEAKRRIVARCPIDNVDGFFVENTRHVSAKNIASLLQALAFVSSEKAWVDSESSAWDVHELLKADLDSAGTIAESWFGAAGEKFRECGRTLGGTAR